MQLLKMQLSAAFSSTASLQEFNPESSLRLTLTALAVMGRWFPMAVPGHDCQRWFPTFVCNVVSECRFPMLIQLIR